MKEEKTIFEHLRERVDQIFWFGRIITDLPYEDPVRELEEELEEERRLGIDKEAFELAVGVKNRRRVLEGKRPMKIHNEGD